MTDDPTSGQLERLAEVERQAQAILDADHFHMHNGEYVRHPDTGELIRDSEPVLRAMDVMLGVLRLRATILGLDAPVRHHLVDEHGNTIDITRLIPLLERWGIVVQPEE